MTDGHCFISYSHADGLDFVTKLADELEGGYPFIKVWFEKREMVASLDDWDDQLAKAIRESKCLLFVMSKDSTGRHSNCKDEWTWALKYKKPVICIWIDNNAEDQFRLNSRQKIDFTTNFDQGLARLRKSIAHLDSPEGELEELNHRLADANRDLRRTSEEKKALIQSDIDELKKQIEVQQRIVDDPEAAKRETEQKIQNGLERERKPEKPLAAYQSSKFINQPPGVEQHHFRDRFTETEQAILFLKNEAQRLLTVVGRGGAGKTAMVCRLLKFIENGALPDDFDKKHGKIDIDGIVYLSEAGSHKVNFANLFEDLCKLLPVASAEKLSALYKEPQTSTDSKALQLLAAFQGLKQVIVLLDNFENVVDDDGKNIKDAELNEALHSFLHAPHHPVKIIITTRVTARELEEYEPARQRLLPLDTGLQPEYAKEAFVLMDEGELVGIKNAGDDLLNLAVTRTLGLPRALEALYAALRTDRFTTLKELLDLPILPEKVVQAYVGEAFNRLDTNAQKVMQALAVYNRPVTPAAVDYLLAPHIPAMDSAPILQRLANMHFARKESGRFYLHPVDREFAFGLIPEKDLTTKDTKVTKEEPKPKTADEEALLAIQRELDALKSSRSLRASRFDAFTQHDLTSRAADYFAQARKPRAEWKKLEDLSAQLAEFDLRCAAGDYDTAASVLTDFDFDYLLLWGHYRLMIDLREKLQEKIKDKELARVNVGYLGLANSYIGRVSLAILYQEKALQIAREMKNRQSEGTWLGNLGTVYIDLGDMNKAVEYCEQALIIAREIGDKKGEATRLSTLGYAHSNSGNQRKAIEYCEQALIIAREIGDRRIEGKILSAIGDNHYEIGEIKEAIERCEQAIDISREIQDRSGESLRLGNLGGYYIDFGDVTKSFFLCAQSIHIADEIGDVQIQNGSRLRLAQAYLFQNDLVNAHATIEAALGYDVPQYNHDASALHGIIALRQGDEVTARGSFVRAIGQADEILSKTAELYDALDAKGLSICGLILCGRGAVPAPNGDGANNTGRGDPAPTINDAIETFRKARKIAPHAGIVKANLRLFDELAKCDKDNVLKDVRDAVEGKDV